MLVLTSLLHLVHRSQDAVPQHAVLVKPHSPKSIGEAPINFILQGTHQTPGINVVICISQPYPEIISTGIIIQFQECDLLIQVAIEGSFLLPVLWDIPLLPSRKLLTRGRVIPVRGHPSWGIITIIIIGVGPLILSPPLLKLSWGIVQPYWCFDKSWGRWLFFFFFFALGHPLTRIGLWL